MLISPPFSRHTHGIISDHLVEVDGANVAGKNETQEGEVGDDTTTLSDKDEAAKVWLARRSRPLASAP